MLLTGLQNQAKAEKLRKDCYVLEIVIAVVAHSS